jgi:hypothetical protein
MLSGSSYTVASSANTSAATYTSAWRFGPGDDDATAGARVPRVPLKPFPTSSVQLAPPTHEEHHSATT